MKFNKINLKEICYILHCNTFLKAVNNMTETEYKDFPEILQLFYHIL